jgi:hypothetical protein
MPNLVLKVLYYFNGSQFLVNKDKNRGRFLFIFPHPSRNGTSVWVNSPWATKYPLDRKMIVSLPKKPVVNTGWITLPTCSH